MIDVEYVGWDGYTNYGDDITKEIILKLGFKNTESDVLMYGAGTLLPVAEELKKKIKGKDFKEVMCLGTGVNDNIFEVENFDELLKETRKVLKDSKFVGLRSEKDKELLGFGEVIGDPMFTLNMSENIEKDENLVVLNVGQSFGNCWGELKAEQECLLNTLNFVKNYVIGKLKKRVVVLSLWNYDDVTAITAAKYLNCPLVLSNTEHNKIIGLLLRASYLICYKLHAMITALVTNTPVVAIEYRPKVVNVAKDFNIDKFTLKTDEVTEETLKEKFDMLKDWNYDEVEKKKNEYGAKFIEFIIEIKKEYGEK